MAQILEYLKITPDDDFLQHALALEYLKIGDKIAARALFEEVLARNPGYVGSYYHLATLLEQLGETGHALQWYEKGLQAAKAAGDNRAYNELKAAHDRLTEE